MEMCNLKGLGSRKHWQIELLFYMYECFPYIGVCTPCMCSAPRSQKRDGAPGTGVHTFNEWEYKDFVVCLFQHNQIKSSIFWGDCYFFTSAGFNHICILVKSYLRDFLSSVQSLRLQRKMNISCPFKRKVSNLLRGLEHSHWKERNMQFPKVSLWFSLKSLIMRSFKNRAAPIQQEE